MSTSMPGGDGASSSAGRHSRIRREIAVNAVPSTPYYLMNGLSAVVASYGLLANSAAVVIGAMIIAMLLGPIVGSALAIVEADRRLLVRSLLTELLGAALVVAVAVGIGSLHRAVPLTVEILARTSPNIMDLAIALAAGAAGAYAALSPRISASIVGVAIATALVPPLCASGICLARGLYAQSGGAFVLFIANLVGIHCATCVVLIVAGFGASNRASGKGALRRFAPSAVLLGALAIGLGYSFDREIAHERLLDGARRYLKGEIERGGAARVVDVQIGQDGGSEGRHVTAVVRAPYIIVPASCARLQAGLERATGARPLRLYVRSVLTRECDAHQFLWESEPTIGTPEVPPAN